MRTVFTRQPIAIVAVFSICLFANYCSAGIIVSVNIKDPTNTYQQYFPAIRSHATAMGSIWGSHFAGTRNIELEVEFDSNISTATGGSITSSFVRSKNGFNVFEQGVGLEVRTGNDSNGLSPDMRITFGTSYLQNELWFDPNPQSRTAPVPADRTDAMSVFLHEFGHAIAFNGWQNAFDGSYPGDYISTFDALRTFDGTDFFFMGPAAMKLYGGPVPVTYGNISHLGNDSTRPGSDLIPDLMNGVVFYRGTRYDISALDLAIISDTGLSVVPEPTSGSIFVIATVVSVLSLRCNQKTRRRIHSDSRRR